MYPQPQYHLIKNPEGFITTPLQKKKFVGGAKILCKCGHKNDLQYTACRKCGLPLNNKKQTYFITKRKESDDMNFSNDTTFSVVAGNKIENNMTELKKYNSGEKYKIRWVCICNTLNDLTVCKCSNCQEKILSPSEQRFKSVWTEIGIPKWDICKNEDSTIKLIKKLEASTFKCSECGFHTAIYNKVCLSCKKSLGGHPYFIAEDEKVKEEFNPQPIPIQEKEEYEWPDLPITKNEELENQEKIDWKNTNYVSVQNRLYKDKNINISFVCPGCQNVSKFGVICEHCNYRMKHNNIFDIREKDEVVCSNTISRIREYLRYNPMKRTKTFEQQISCHDKRYKNIKYKMKRYNLDIRFKCSSCSKESVFDTIICKNCNHRLLEDQVFNVYEKNMIVYWGTLKDVYDHIYDYAETRTLIKGEIQKQTSPPIEEKNIPVEKFITITTGTTTKKFSVVGKKISHILEMFRESGMESDFLLNGEKVDSSTILKHEDNLKLIPKEIEKNAGVIMKILKGLETTIIPQEEITGTFIEVEQILTYTNEDILDTLIQNNKLNIYKSNWDRSPRFINTDEIAAGLHDIREEERKKEVEQKVSLTSDIEKRLLNIESKLNDIEKGMREITYIKLGVISILKFLQKLDERI